MLASLCLALTAHGPLPARSPTALARDKKTVAAIEDYLEACEFFGWSGAVLVEQKGRVVLCRGFGKADRELDIDCDENTVFEIASATKAFTACGILALVDDGRVDLDASIAEYLPGVPEARHNITVRHLLSHTSGMGRTQGGASGLDLEAAVKGCLEPTPYREPGVEYDYWNQGYALLAGIIENVTEEGYLGFMRSRIFAKAGLESTGFTGDELWPKERQAVAYAADAPLRHAADHPYESYGYQYRGMGGIVTTVEELWKLGSAALNGKLLKKSTTREMLEEVDGSYGLGWRFMKTKRGSRQVGHGGDVRGFHTSMNFFPEEDAAVIVVSSVDTILSRQLAWNVETLLLDGGVGVYGPPKIEPVKQRVLDGCAGTYGDGAGLTLTVRAVGPGLEVLGEDLGGSSLLMGSVDLDAAAGLIESTEKLVRSIIKGDPGPMAEMMAKRIPATWPEVLVRSIYPDRVDGLGPLQGITALACRAAGAKDGECFLRLNYESGSVVLQALYQRGRLERFDLKANAPVPRLRFAQATASVLTGKRREPKEDEESALHTHEWDVFKRMDPKPTLRFEPSLRRPRTLILDIPGLGEIRLPRVE